MPETVPVELRDFILRHIDSIAHLEALLLMYREQSRRWQPALLSARLYICENEALAILTRLETSGLIHKDGDDWFYAPALTNLGNSVDQLADHYTRQLIPITRIVHSKSSGIQQFADAFRMRKDD